MLPARLGVIDGDTIVIAGEHVRLRGVDAPEMDQTCAAKMSTIGSFERVGRSITAYSTDYLEAEAEAKRRGAGVWRGQFVPPWQWRSERR